MTGLGRGAAGAFDGDLVADEGQGAFHHVHADLARHLAQQLPRRNRANPSPDKVNLADPMLVEQGADTVERLGHTGSLAGVQG